MARYSCNFHGQCEPDPDGIYSLAAECSEGCQPSYLPPDLMYITEAYHVRPWRELAPTDRVRVVKELLGEELSIDEATHFLRVWQEDWQILLLEYPDFFWANVDLEGGEVAEYLQQLRPIIRSEEDYQALATDPEFEAYRQLLFGLADRDHPLLDSEPHSGQGHFYNIILRTPEEVPPEYIPLAFRHYQTNEYFRQNGEYALIGEVLAAQNPQMILELLRMFDRPGFRQGMINDPLHNLRNKLPPEQWQYLLDRMREEFGIVPQP